MSLKPNDHYRNLKDSYLFFRISKQVAAYKKEHPEYLEPDKIHPNYKGGKVLVKLIYDAIYNNISKEKLF